MSKIFETKHCIIFAIVMFLVGAIALTFVGCNQIGSEPNENNTLKAGKLTVAVEENNYPAVYKNDNGKIVGVEINYLEKLCKEAGFEVEYKTMPFNQIIDAINKHDVDVSMNQISVTDGRKSKVDFSEPYNKNGVSLYVKEDSSYTVDSLKQKAVRDKLNVATLDGTYYENFKSTLEGTVNNLPYSYVEDCIASVQSGETDCFVFDSNPIALIDFTKNKHLKGLFLNDMPEYDIAIALNKNLKGVNEKLYPVMLKMNNERYLQRVQEYFYTLDNPKAWDGILPAGK